jgi:hypothetical protein
LVECKIEALQEKWYSTWCLLKAIRKTASYYCNNNEKKNYEKEFHILGKVEFLMKLI